MPVFMRSASGAYPLLEEPQFCGPLGPLLFDFSHPFPQHAPVVVNPTTSLRQFVQVNYCGLIGINEPHHFSVEGGELALQAPPFLCRTDIYCGVTTPVLLLPPQHRGGSQQGFHVLPDARLNQHRTEAAARARPWRIPEVAQGADIPTALRTPRAHHAPATAPTDHQTPQPI